MYDLQVADAQQRGQQRGVSTTMQPSVSSNMFSAHTPDAAQANGILQQRPVSSSTLSTVSCTDDDARGTPEAGRIGVSQKGHGFVDDTGADECNAARRRPNQHMDTNANGILAH